MILDNFTKSATQTVEIKGLYWFSPHFQFEGTVVNFEWSENEHSVVADVTYRAQEDTIKDLTVQTLRAKLMRWLFDNSSIFRWTYTHLAKSAPLWKQSDYQEQ